MKRQMRKARKKLPMLWDESMDFEVAIRPLASNELEPELPENIVMLPLPSVSRKTPPPPLAA